MQKQTIELSTSSGKLRGTVELSCLDDEYYAFRGIPYARPPVGDLRFRDPEPAEPWNDRDLVKDAINFGPRALQFDAVTGKAVGSEDCLYLNVYTRTIEAKSPVMVWIHGGGFLTGCADDEQFGPDYLLARGVVMVTVTYRLGVFGFLNLEHPQASGNQGLKDQAMALRWVQGHIGAFGGDPDNVTIFGGSAGAGCVHLLALSTWSRDLFHKAICQSGVALNPWAIVAKPFEAACDFLREMGFTETTSEPQKMVDYLRKADATKMIEVQMKLMSPLSMIKLSFTFGPCIDEKSERPFLPTDPTTLTTKPGVPFLVGYNSMEGIMALEYLPFIDATTKMNINSLFSESTKKILKKYYGLTTRDLLKNYKINGLIDNNENIEKFLKLWSVISFNEGIRRFARTQCVMPIYFYKLTFDDNETLSKLKPRLCDSIRGVNHGDELVYLFKAKKFEAKGLEQLGSKDTFELMKRMTEFWTNFAKNGKPTDSSTSLNWPQLTPNSLLCMNIDKVSRIESIIATTNDDILI